MVDEPVARTLRGPNERQPCPSTGCRVWHLAHGLVHHCGIDQPAPQRTDTTREAA